MKLLLCIIALPVLCNCWSGRNLNDECTNCECQGTYEGVVQSTEGIPINNVTLSMNNTTYHILTTTTPDGRYTLENLCLDQIILFYKEGYTPETAVSHSLPNVVQLKRHESLMMDLHPSSKKRLVGDNVLFCCAAIGNPPPTFYEWFKDGQQLAGESGSTLSLSSLTLESTGRYRCRANSESGRIYSAEATLAVRDNGDDFCPGIPEVKYQKLPSGCDVEAFNVGECASLKCRGDVIRNETCGDVLNYCCAATEYEEEVIVCDGFNFTVKKAVHCGCAQCVKPVVDIQGFVFTAKDNTPLEGVDIYYNKTVVTQTAVNGQFYFTVIEGTLRVSITAKKGNGTEYSPGTKVLTLNENANGVYYTTIKLSRVIMLAPINSTADQTISLETEESAKTFLKVHIPAHSFYDENGFQYQGMVTPLVTTINPNSIQEMESAPGDFTTVDKDGELQLLQTYGMFNVDFRGGDGVHLQVNNFVNLMLQAETLGNVDTGNSEDSSSPLDKIKLFVMNERAGIWEKIADIDQCLANRLRKKRQNGNGCNITGITLDKFWYNLAAVPSTTCYSKVRVFENNDFDESEQKTGSQIYAIVEEDTGMTHSFSTRLAHGNDERNGYCVAHHCKKKRNQSNFRGYLVLEKDGKYLIPAMNDTSLGEALEQQLHYVPHADKLEISYDLTKITDNNGPFYDTSDGNWLHSKDCIAAGFDHKHFQFHLHEEDQCYKFSEITLKSQLTDICNPVHYKSWYTAFEKCNETYTTCYAKVKVSDNSSNIIVQTFSRVGTLYHKSATEEITPGDLYGYQEDCVIGGGVVCIKIKPPGTRGCSTDNAHNLEDMHTVVSINTRQENGLALNATIIHEDLVDQYNAVVSNSQKEIHFQMTTHDTFGGIFCETRQSPTPVASRIEAYRECASSPGETFAVQFGSDSP